MVPFLGELVVAAVRADRHHRVILRECADAPRTSRNLQTYPVFNHVGIIMY